MLVVMKPGDKARVTGHYEPIDATGKLVGVFVLVEAGKQLPTLPEGYRWRLAEPVPVPPASGSSVPPIEPFLFAINRGSVI